MEMNDIFTMWDEAREKRKQRFKLKPFADIYESDTPYIKEIKELTNQRRALNLSAEDVAKAFGYYRSTVHQIENFVSGENWTYCYALRYLFLNYDAYLFNQKGLIVNNGIKQ